MMYTELLTKIAAGEMSRADVAKASPEVMGRWSTPEWLLHGAGAVGGGLLAHVLGKKFDRKAGKGKRLLYALAGAAGGGLGTNYLLNNIKNEHGESLATGFRTNEAVRAKRSKDKNFLTTEERGKAKEQQDKEWRKKNPLKAKYMDLIGGKETQESSGAGDAGKGRKPEYEPEEYKELKANMKQTGKDVAWNVAEGVAYGGAAAAGTIPLHDVLVLGNQKLDRGLLERLTKGYSKGPIVQGAAINGTHLIDAGGNQIIYDANDNIMSIDASGKMVSNRGDLLTQLEQGKISRIGRPDGRRGWVFGKKLPGAATGTLPKSYLKRNAVRQALESGAKGLRKHKGKFGLLAGLSSMALDWAWGGWSD